MSACSQVTLRNVLLDVPQHSWSDSFFRMVCRDVSILTPASASLPGMSRPEVKDWLPEDPQTSRSFHMGNAAAATRCADGWQSHTGEHLSVWVCGGICICTQAFSNHPVKSW